MMDITIVDENGVVINQLDIAAESTMSPLLKAFCKWAYENDPRFTAIIDDLANSVAQAIDEYEAGNG